MKHIKTINSSTLNKDVNKAGAANVKHLASQHARLLHSCNRCEKVTLLKAGT